MKHVPLSDLQTVEFARIATPNRSNLRRRRLEQFADLLENHVGPIHLFEVLEAVPARRRRRMRLDSSPFAIAFVDPLFRAEGLESDRVGDASAFFGLSALETHELVCDCHYFGPVSGRTVAERARFMAAHPRFAARLRNFVADFAPWGANA